MATQEAKAVRRAIALNELDRLSGLLAEAFKIELPNLRPTHRDADLQRIQRIEAINELLVKVLEANGVTTQTKTPEAEPAAEEEVAGLDHMKKAELLELAKSKNLDVDNSFTKAEIIEALNA